MARLSPSRIAVFTFALVATLIVLGGSRWNNVSQTAQTASPPAVDLSSFEAREEFLHFFRGTDSAWPDSLMKECGKYGDRIDSYRVGAFATFQLPGNQQVELRASGSEATSLRYVLPPPFARDRPRDDGSPNLPLARAVSRDVLENIGVEMERLWADRIPLMGLEGIGTDGQAVYLEFCHRGRYGFYSRTNPDSAKADDARIVAVANMILVTAGEPVFKP